MSKETKTTRELSYYELYLLDYLRQHKFTEQHDRDFIRTRADEAAETYEQERRNGHTPDQAQELAMSALTKGLHYSQYDILLGVIDSEFEKSVPPLLHEQLAENRTFCRSWARCFPSMTLPMMIFHSLTNTRTSTMN